MTSLVAADYGNSSSDEKTDSEDEQITAQNNCYELSEHSEQSDSDCSDSNSETKDINEIENSKASKSLPSASSLFSNAPAATSGQVFSNPYKVAENAQIASLEKHVKMVDNKAHTNTINGKKICWNYRKGRCRFGSNCTFAHDSDLNVKNDVIGNEIEPKQNINATSSTIKQISNNSKNQKSKVQDEARNVQKKKRPGLSDSIVPSKKVMKTYNTLRSSK